MSATSGRYAPICAGIFGEPDHVDEALKKLKENGFTNEEISVVTTASEFQSRFAPYLENTHAGRNLDNRNLTFAGIAGLSLAVLAALAIFFMTSESSVYVLGAFSGIALLGTFVALMMTRGIKKEPADFFDQELDKHEILVAIEEHGDDAEQRLNLAEKILRDAGSKPIPLAEG